MIGKIDKIMLPRYFVNALKRTKIQTKIHKIHKTGIFTQIQDRQDRQKCQKCQKSGDLSIEFESEA